VVHGRNNNKEEDEFGVSGYVYENTFLIFDRRTHSLWYPLNDQEWTAISGPRKGEKLPFLEDMPLMKLGEWRTKYPNTVVLLGSKKEIESAKAVSG
jgi:hypothetical protein